MSEKTNFPQEDNPQKVANHRAVAEIINGTYDYANAEGNGHHLQSVLDVLVNTFQDADNSQPITKDNLILFGQSYAEAMVLFGDNKDTKQGEQNISAVLGLWSEYRYPKDTSKG